jgi:ABC-type hemin transport system ATPase subunit
MRQRKKRLESQVRRLVSAVAESGHSPAILGELGRKEAELQAITGQLLSASPDSIELRIDEIRKFVTNRLANVLDVLRNDSALARTEILKHRKEITMTPQRNGQKPFYAAEGNWDYCEAIQGWIAD